MKPEFRVSARIAKPVGEVFDAVVNPKKLSGYFTTIRGASAPLVAGTTVTWWGEVPVEVDEVEADRHIMLRWDGAGADVSYKTRIDMNFEPIEDGATLVTIAETGWCEDAKAVRRSYGNCEGWSQMLCCMKAYLEYGINLREGYYRSELKASPRARTTSNPGMEDAMTAKIKGGINIAMKVPTHQYEATIAFYRDVVGLKPFDAKAPAVGFELGSNRLWIDEAPMVSQAALWLELFTDDFPSTAEHFAKAGVVHCDAIEPLGDGFRGGWITNPANIIHMVREPDAW